MVCSGQPQLYSNLNEDTVPKVAILVVCGQQGSRKIIRQSCLAPNPHVYNDYEIIIIPK